MAMRDAAPVLLFALLCVAGAVAPVAPVAATPDDRATGPGVEPLVQQGVEPDSTRIVVDVRENGDAHWEIQYWTRLDDQNTTEAFSSLQTDVRENPGDYTVAFAERIDGTVTAAENATGRDMAATNYTVSAETRSLPDSYGVVTYGFDWSNFAAVDGDRLVVGDAIEGFFLQTGSRLIVSWPEEYGAASVSPDPDDTRENAVIWRGADTEFVSGEPRLVLEPGGGPPPTATPADGGDGSPVDDPFPTTGAVVALVVVGVLAVGAAFYLRSRGVFGSGGGPSDADGEPEGVVADETEAVASDASPADASPESVGVDATADDAPSPPPELLSNEERVLRLIESRGGRIKQQEVAGALDWTDAKTSKVVRGMREEGTIEGFRLGRENVLRLPESDEDDDGPAEE